MSAPLLKIYSDFNTRTADDLNIVLFYQGKSLSDQLERLGLAKGDKVILYQDDDDFEVIATLDFKYDEFLGHETLLAIPDWSTIIYLRPRPLDDPTS